MALIGKLRKQKWLLVGSMAAALLLFIAMLMFDNPNQSLFGGSRTMIGDIEGNKLEYQEFSKLHEMLYRNTTTDGFSDRTFLWNFFVEQAIVQKEADAFGLGVSKAELIDLQFSNDPGKLSPVISSRYQDPNTGQVDLQQLAQLKDIITTNKIDEMIQAGQLVPDFKFRWAHQEREIIKNRLQTKLTSIVSKGMYTPTWMAEMISQDQNARIDFAYVQVPFDEIENSEVSLSDDDFKAYFEENKQQFKQDQETRKVDYVVFDVVPTAADSAEISKRIADLVEPFKSAENDSLFVENNYGTIDEAYFKKDELSPAIADTILDLPIGAVYGPYLDGNTYKAVKLLGNKVVADSVKARHILRRASDQATYFAADKLIDSLKALIETGAGRFDSLAVTFSEDGSNSSKGGDLGFFTPGVMVKPFNDVAFFKAEPGKVYKVVTQFGVHLLEVTDRKTGGSEASVKLAYISQDIVPSQGTQDAALEEALQLQEQNTTLDALRKAAIAKGLDVQTSPGLTIDDYTVGNLGIGQGSRDIVRWVFGKEQNTKPPKPGQVSPQVYSYQAQGQFYTNKYVVAAFNGTRPAGMPSWQDVKADIEPQVINFKKGEMIKGKMKGMTDLASIASTFSVKVDTAANVTYAGAQIPNIGSEPKVVASAFKVDLNQLSAPIVGNTGVFVVKPASKPEAPAAGNIAQVRQSAQFSARSVVASRLVEALKKNADITDNRSNFF